MMPGDEDIAELVAFLPRLEAKDLVVVEGWGGGVKNADGVMTFPWPIYASIVGEFFSVASKDCWCDFQYSAHDPAAKLDSLGFIENASLAELKTLLTFCARGERFCDGHWGAMIEAGYIVRILRRLEVLGKTER
jgi:hypothetical protein